MALQATLGGFREVHHYDGVWKIKSGLKKPLFQVILNNLQVFPQSLDVQRLTELQKYCSCIYIINRRQQIKQYFTLPENTVLK